MEDENFMIYVLEYCRELSRLVSPNDADRLGLRHDGAVSGFIGCIVEHLKKGDSLDTFPSAVSLLEYDSNNEDNNTFEASIYHRIKEDVINKGGNY